MDVISTVRPENNVNRSGSALRARSRDKKPNRIDGYRETKRGISRKSPFLFNLSHRDQALRPDTASRPDAASLAPTFALPRENPGFFSFPAIAILSMSLLLALSPVFERGFGHYRLERVSFPSDPSDESAMRSLVTPEPDASLIASGAESELPATIRSVTYSSWRVRSGDTIGGILARFGLRNMSTILSANGIANARRLRVGQNLTVPSMDGVVHTVARGDSLARIASRYDVPVTAILDANDLSVDTVILGQRLFVPGASLSATELRRAMGQLFVWPIKGRLTSRFGIRPDPFTGVRTFHTGIDLAAPTGTTVKATLDGRVATTGYSSVFGNYVIISHDSGFQSLYGHLSAIGVSRGQTVTQGTAIGKVGNTGYSTGSHLHLSLYKNGKMVDPLSVLD